MTKRSRIAAAGGVAAAAMLLAAPMATAAPKKGNQFTVTCPGLAPFNVVTPPGNGAFTPAFGPGSPVSIPYRTTGTVTVNGDLVEEFDNVKPAPAPSSAITCAFEASFVDPAGNNVSIVGTATVVPRPR
ncbi:MAG: hypothetical protein ACRDIL_01140 [Candidatus Limnocylindrales bacterium]